METLQQNGTASLKKLKKTHKKPFEIEQNNRLRQVVEQKCKLRENAGAYLIVS